MSMREKKKMTRRKKEGTYINIKIRQDIYEQFCEYAERKGQTKTMAMERILEKYLETESKKKEERV